MTKFSIIEVVDWTPHYRTALSLVIQLCVANDEARELFTEGCQLFVFKRGKVVIEELKKHISGLEVTPSEILVVARTPADMDIDDFHEQLLPFVERGLKLLVVNESGFGAKALAIHNHNVLWWPFGNKEVAAGSLIEKEEISGNVTRILRKF